jgi:hypothetical protein
MATESSFSKGWKQFVDHKWNKKICHRATSQSRPLDALVANVALAFPQTLLVRLADHVFHCVHLDVRKETVSMAAIKVGVREFREKISTFLESDTPVAVTRRGETLGVYVPTRRKHTKTADVSELKAAADRLSQALADVDEDELVDEFKTLRRRGKVASR